MVYLFCAYRDWTLRLYDRLSKEHKMILLSNPKQLSLKYVKKINPKIIFFPDWSWIIPEEIVQNYRCVCIHESNLPKFRGGSPIQNQIIRNIKNTKSTAFIMNEKLDAGDILLQRNLSLDGSLADIFSRIIENDYFLINKIIEGKFKRRKQVGRVTTFRRRKPAESELTTLEHPDKYLYNFIRMLADPYPNAFIRIGKRKIVFKDVKYDGKRIMFNGEII